MTDALTGWPTVSGRNSRGGQAKGSPVPFSRPYYVLAEEQTSNERKSLALKIGHGDPAANFVRTINLE